jgi:eukaryotic-like serine/threonine-protein kinase
VNVECPYCRHPIKVTGVKEGRYSPKCPGCGHSFVLSVIATGDDLRFDVQRLVGQALALPVSPPSAVPLKEEVPAAVPAAVPVPGVPVAEAVPGPKEPTQIPVAKTVAGTDGIADFDMSRDGQGTGTGLEVLPRLGGYEILRILGRGGMGVVYLARQVSLDRPVALKVMHQHWASDPGFLARFTREAYAAAQLVHHNIVQIYDIGEQGGVPFFSMEYVRGRTLTQVVKEQGPLDPAEAAGYILQAARGLAHAHAQGLVHRDVKPDNLMLNEHGVIKVADLGLVKTAGAADPIPLAEPASADEQATDRMGENVLPAGISGSPSLSRLSQLPSVTRAGTTVGTPNYMSPEQGRNAATVDGRADIYSLGCTLYALLTGRPPFQGETGTAVLLKHIREPVVPPERFAPRVPPDLSAIVLKMMAKDPAARFADMGEVVHALEGFLGRGQAAPFSPTVEQAEALAHRAREFNEAPAAALRSRVRPGFLATAAILTVVAGAFSLRLAVGIAGLAGLTLLFSFLGSGFTQRTHLFLRVREWVLGGGWGDVVVWAVALLAILAVSWFAGLLPFWLGFCVFAIALAATYYFLVQRPLAAQRNPPLEHAEKLLRVLRLRGASEDAIRRLVSEHAGDRWEEFFEALFGYHALIQARTERARSGRPGQVHAGWRDPIIRWINARQQARQEARARRLLQTMEEKGRQAEGVEPSEARAQARQAAEVMVAQAAELKDQEAGPNATPAVPAVRARDLVEMAEQPEPRPRPRWVGRLLGAIFNLFFGPQVRFLLGAALLTLFGLWLYLNDLVPGDVAALPGVLKRLAGARPLQWLPPPLDVLLSGINTGAAGLLLVLSALTRSGKVLFFVLPAVAVILTGHHVGLPGIGPLRPEYVSLLAGLALAEFGVVFARSTEER